MIIDVKLFEHDSDSSAMFIFSTYFYTFRIRRRNNRSSNETASKPSRTLFLPRLCYSDSRARAFPSSSFSALSHSANPAPPSSLLSTFRCVFRSCFFPISF